MDLRELQQRFADTRKLPKPVYESVVRSLYDDINTLAVGSVSMIIAPLVPYHRVGDPVQLWFSIIFGMLGIMRLIDASMFRRASRKPDFSDKLQRWEWHYVILGAIYVGTLGLWCMASIARTSDQFVHQMTVIVTISYLIGIMGRNFSSNKVVLSQTICAATPLILGAVLFGDAYDLALGLFLWPMFFTIWSMSRKLRYMLFNAVLTALSNKVIADRFNVALSNVSHGMAMFDKEAKFVVVNSRFAGLCGLADETDLVGMQLDALPDKGAIVESDDGPLALRKVLQNCLEDGKHAQFNHLLTDGRVIEAKYNPMESEGGVLVLEDITERVNTENEIRKLASFDPLTHLPNRRFFMAEVNRVIGGVEGLEPCTVFFVDLDNFKDVNDTLGHTVGDKLLCSVALRMRSAMPERAMACRFGGDEFVVVVPGKVTRKDASAFADRLIEEISKPALIDGHQLVIGASIGIAQCPVNGNDYNQLLKVSDVALYDAKARGRGCYSFYTDELGDIIRDRRHLENELRRALDRNQLELHYQPLINMEENRITTFEALVRWNHPERGMIPPSVFIPVAEEIGFISQIGKFVLETATRQCMQWPHNISVAVNVSSLQFQQSDVCSVVGSALAKSGLSANRLEVEVTESAMLESVEETNETLKRLAQSGVRISLDDFGTGFSSLSYLHTLPLDKVKIDRSFIENIQTDERSLVLLSGVTHLAHELGLSITIEGVETAEQMEILCAKVHVNEMQGYLFGRAIPASDVADLLAIGSGTISVSRQTAAS
ncbi:MAG: EAL domain-containing protein [Pseudomonadota bacterium]|nr:EAL domain-containing protein [Pseudomonadota bacterium]